MQKNIKIWLAKHTAGIRILFWLYAVTLTWLLLRRSQKKDLELLNIDFGFLYNDKIVHTTTFLLLTLLGIFSFSRTKPIIFVIIFTVYGILIEFLQGYMKLGRTFEYSDMLCDFIGCLIGLTITKIIQVKNS